MKIYRDDSITLELSNGDVNEPAIALSVFKKMNDITRKAGFKKDFTVEETDFVRKVYEVMDAFYNKK